MQESFYDDVENATSFKECCLGNLGNSSRHPLKKSPYLEPVYKGGVATKNVSEFDIYFEQSAFICASWSEQYLSYLYISDQ